MSISTAYLTSLKNLKGILNSIQGAQAPKKFTTRFLASLGYSSVNDRLIIGVLKTLRFLTAEGAPTKRYYEYLDQTQSGRVLAEGVREAYAELFQVNRKAYDLSNADVKNKLKTLTQGQVSEAVLGKMAGTFKALSQHADFSVVSQASEQPERTEPPLESPSGLEPSGERKPPVLGGLVYNIQIVLPSDRDQAVYDALFKSLKEHLLK